MSSSVNTDVSVARSREQTRECDVCGSRNGQAVCSAAPEDMVEGIARDKIALALKLSVQLV